MTNNPKQTHASPQDFIWLFFGLGGRISREPYWLGIILTGAFSLVILLSYISEATTPEELPNVEVPAAVTILFLVLRWCEIALAAKRAHDKGLSGFIAVLVLLPFLNIAVIMFLGIVSGDPGPNRYGKFPNTRPT